MKMGKRRSMEVAQQKTERNNLLNRRRPLKALQGQAMITRKAQELLKGRRMEIRSRDKMKTTPLKVKKKVSKTTKQVSLTVSKLMLILNRQLAREIMKLILTLLHN